MNVLQSWAYRFTTKYTRHICTLWILHVNSFSFRRCLQRFKPNAVLDIISKILRGISLAALIFTVVTYALFRWAWYCMLSIYLSMNVCMYAHMHVCMYVRICAHMYVCMYVCNLVVLCRNATLLSYNAKLVYNHNCGDHVYVMIE